MALALKSDLDVQQTGLCIVCLSVQLAMQLKAVFSTVIVNSSKMTAMILKYYILIFYNQMQVRLG